MQLNDVLAKLSKVEGNGIQYSARCPAHSDDTNSLSIAANSEKIALHCHAGCDKQNILDAMGLKLADLFLNPLDKTQTASRNIEYLYHNEQGTLIHKTVRKPLLDGKKKFLQCRPDGSGGWIWNLKDITPILYNLRALIDAVAKGETVYVVEGEKDVESLKAFGLVATTNPMGAGKWKSDYNSYFNGADVVILPDNDISGQKHSAEVLKNISNIAKSVKIVKLPDLPEKGDVSDWIKAGGTKGQLLALVNEKSKELDLKEQNTGKVEDEKFWINGEYIECPWIKAEWNEKKQKNVYKVLTSALAEHIRTNTHYIFVRDNASNSVLRYWYRSGYYQQISDFELKGAIKSFIPLFLQRTGDINEVFNLLITDLKFIPIDSLNSNEHIINFQNGLLNLETMELVEHTPNEYCTIQIPCSYNPSPKVPESRAFDKFIDHLTQNREDVKSLLLQFMGIAISNIKGWRMKKALFMVGEGDVGKSQLKQLSHRLIGANNSSGIDLSALEERFGTSSIFNKRIIGSNDMQYATITELKTFKKIVGGDTLHAEFKGQASFPFVYGGVAWFCANKLPKFGGDKGDHVYNRIMVVECNNPVSKKDKFLQDKMFTEREYIVSLAVKEIQKVIKNNYEFVIPDSMKKSTENYKVDNNSFLSFMSECTVNRIGDKIQDDCTAKRFFDVYVAWCKDNHNGYYEPKKEVKAILKSMGKDNITPKNGYDCYSKFTLKGSVKKDYAKIYGNDMSTHRPDWYGDE